MATRTDQRTPDRISVCICAFRRPVLLGRLLDALDQQRTDSEFEFEIVVVDNDAERTSEAVVAAFSKRARVPVTYVGQPERNISLTRNVAVAEASGNLIAFIDDDEWPVQEWLAQLHRTMARHEADGVLGPVLPEFPAAAPQWLKKGRFFDRRRHRSGTAIEAGDARTGNVLLRRSLFPEGGLWFDPQFGRTGGEDSDFFARQLRAHHRFVWCDEAVAYETVPPERWAASFHVRRLWRAGTLDGEWMRDGRLVGRGLLLRNVAILAACSAAIVPALAAPKHLRVKVARKLAYCGGLLTAYMGLSLLRTRD